MTLPAAKLDEALRRADAMGRRDANAFEVGDRVKVVYGQFSGKRGEVIDVAPSGRFFVVKVGNNTISVHESDIKK